MKRFLLTLTLFIYVLISLFTINAFTFESNGADGEH